MSDEDERQFFLLPQDQQIRILYGRQKDLEPVETLYRGGKALGVILIILFGAITSVAGVWAALSGSIFNHNGHQP